MGDFTKGIVPIIGSTPKIDKIVGNWNKTDVADIEVTAILSAL